MISMDLMFDATNMLKRTLRKCGIFYLRVEFNDLSEIISVRILNI